LGDFYYRQAKSLGYRSRSALKLKEIAKGQGLLRPGERVADLGAAPGGWLQVERELVGEKGLVVGMDLSVIRPLPYENVKTIQGDITDPKALNELLAITGGAVDTLVSDLAPKFTGIHDLDQARQIDLARVALKAASTILKKGGSMVVKVIMGGEFEAFHKEIHGKFTQVRIIKPKASRESSTETYMVCRGFLG
jgi:23S rRNA (uridine2552-2'-O)-methyltransferase